MVVVAILRRYDGWLQQVGRYGKRELISLMLSRCSADYDTFDHNAGLLMHITGNASSAATDGGAALPGKHAGVAIRGAVIFLKESVNVFDKAAFILLIMSRAYQMSIYDAQIVSE